MLIKKYSLVFRCVQIFLAFLLAVSPVQAQTLPSLNVNSSQIYQPLTLKGVMVDPSNPFRFDFVVDPADQASDVSRETTRLVKFFLTSVAVSDRDLWVNLSPVEPDRVIPSVLGQTEMGKILLEQDAVLKQLTARLMSPESETGSKLWEKVYEKINQVDSRESLVHSKNANDQRQTTIDVIDSFNKVWIVPGESVIVADGTKAYIQSSSLKVMLESDYLMQKDDDASGMKDVIRQHIVPAIEQAVNQSPDFAPLRQVFSAHLLAVWYKNHLHESAFNQVYADSQKINGITTDPSFKDEVYQQYLKNFQSGAFDVIKEDYDPQTQDMIARKYFSGGVLLEATSGFHVDTVVDALPAMLADADGAMVVPFEMRKISDRAQLGQLQLFDPERHSILVVDDDSMQRMFYVRFLKSLGYVVLEAYSKEKALSVYKDSVDQDKPVGLVITDLQMLDDRDGIDLARELWESDVRVPVFLHSGQELEELRKVVETDDRPQNIFDYGKKNTTAFRADLSAVIERAQHLNDVSQAMLAGQVGKTLNGSKIKIDAKDVQDRWVAKQLADTIAYNNERNLETVFILPTGSTPKAVYKYLIEEVKSRQLDLSRLITFNMDEYYPGAGYNNPKYHGNWQNHPDSYFRFMRDNLFEALFALGLGLKAENLNIFNGQAQDPVAEAKAYEGRLDAALNRARESGAKTVGMGGVGVDGHIAFNESAVIVDWKKLALENFDHELRDNNDFVLNGDNPENMLKKILETRQGLRSQDDFVDHLLTGINKRIDVENEKKRKESEGWQDLRHFARQDVKGIAQTLRQQKVSIYVEGLDQNPDLLVKLKSVADQFGDVEILDTRMMYNSLSRPVDIAVSTVIANAPYFENPAEINGKALTIGLGTFRKMDQLFILAYGDGKADAVREATQKPASYESSLSLVLKHHPAALLVVDPESARDVRFMDHAVRSTDDQTGDVMGLFQNIDRALYKRSLYFSQDGKPLSGMMWRRKGAPDKVGNLNIYDFPVGEKVLVLEFDNDDFKTYLPGQEQILRENYPGEEWEKNVRVIKLSKGNDGRTSLNGVDFEALLKFAPGIVFVPTTEFDPRLAELLRLLASQRTDGLGVEYYSRVGDRYPITLDIKRIPVGQLNNADDLKDFFIPSSPNMFVFADQETAENSLGVVRQFKTQIGRTPFDTMIRWKQRLSALLARYFGVSVESEYADMGVVLEYDFKTQEIVFTSKNYQFAYGEESNDPADPSKIVLNKNSVVSEWSPHPDDPQVNNDLKYQIEMQHGIPRYDTVQDWSGNAAYVDPNQGSYEEGSALRREELIASYSYLIKSMGYEVERIDSNNLLTGGLEQTILKAKDTDIFVTINHLAASYGKNKPGTNGVVEEDVIGMMVDLLKAQITETLAKTGKDKLTTLLIRVPHMKDQHPRHRAFFFRAMNAVLFQLARDKEFDLENKVERLVFDLYMSTWAGDGQTYAHFKPEEAEAELPDVPVQGIWGENIPKAIALVRQKILGMASSELATDAPGGATFSADQLGGDSASRSRREGIEINPLTVEAARAMWALYVRQNAVNTLDDHVLTGMVGLLLAHQEKNQPINIVAVSPKPHDIDFLKNVSAIKVSAADVNSDKVRLAVGENSDVPIVEMKNPADFSLAAETVSGIVDLNQVASTLPFVSSVIKRDLPTIDQYLESSDRILTRDGFILLSLKLATNSQKGFVRTPLPDDVGNETYYYYTPEEISAAFDDLPNNYEFVVPDGLVQTLNDLSDGNRYVVRQTSRGPIILREDGKKKPIAMVFAKNMGPQRDILVSMEEALPVAETVAVQGLVESDAAALNAPGGIDLGYGDSVKVKFAGESDDAEESGAIMRLRQSVIGVVPVALEKPVVLKEFVLQNR